MLIVAAMLGQSGGEYVGQPALPGFVVGHSLARGGSSIEERVPQGETVHKWSRMVTVQRFAGVALNMAPAPYLQNIADNLLPRSCPGARASEVRTFAVAARPAAQMRVTCPLNPQTGLPETFYMRAIAGAQDLHVAQVAFRSVPSKADAQWAEKHLDQVTLCGPASNDAVCRRR